MKLSEIVTICNKAIPQEMEWRSMAGESYGLRPTSVSLDTEIGKALFCVTHNSQVEQYAKDNGYDMTISHHPAWSTTLPHLNYHTALDCCRGGLNDMWADAIGLKNHLPFDGTLGAVGRMEKPIEFRALLARCVTFMGDTEPEGGVSGDYGGFIKKVVICTGLGGMVTSSVERIKPDCFITGQLSRHPQGISIPYIIETGHTLSERCGLTVFKGLLEPHGVQVDAVPLEMDVFGGETHLGRKRLATV